MNCKITENYLREKVRMTDTVNGICTCNCEECPLSMSNNGENEDCCAFETLYPEKAVEIVQKWSNEHPRKTLYYDIVSVEVKEKEHNTNDMCESEVKQKIEMIKQGKLPPIPSVDNQSTKGLVTSDTDDSEAKRIIKCVKEGKLPPIFDEEEKQ